MSLYEQDFYQWIEEQAALLKAGALSQLDVENLIEEVESMGKSQKKELYSRLIILISHLLKWDYQPDQIPIGSSNHRRSHCCGGYRYRSTGCYHR